MALPRKAEAMRRLQVALDKIPSLKKSERKSHEFQKWHRNTKIAIENVFGVKSDHFKEFTIIRYSPRIISGPVLIPDSTPDYKTRNHEYQEHEYQERYVYALGRAAILLESMIDEIKEYWEDEAQEPTSYIDSTSGRTNANKIFIIHGRDNETKETVARFLEHLDLKPIILHEQSNRGRTIIEKFEQYTQVGFAVALLTPDDVGALQEKTLNLKPRARQNVIFEFGYFIGWLGRDRVCALTKGNVEIPSDYDGVIYIPLDDTEGWKIELVRELRGAGIDVDANRAF